MNLDDFRETLFAWYAELWPSLLDYQRRFVENGYKDDNTWGYEFGTKPYRGYPWQLVIASIAQNPELHAVVDGGHATEFGGRGGNLAQTIGQGLLDAAYKRMIGNTLLLGKPDATFAAVYEQIADYLSATVLPFRAVSLLNNIRTHAPLELDATTSIAFAPNDLRSDPRWNDVLLDDPHELPAVFVEGFTSPKVPFGSTVDLLPIIEQHRATAEDGVLAITVVRRQYGSAGTMLIEPAGWMPSPSSSRYDNHLPSVRGERTVIEADDRELLRSAWAAIHVKRDQRLRSCVSRLRSADGERNDGEAILELLTGLEAIIGEDGERQLKRRISMVAARLVAEELAMTERRIFDVLWEAFEIRTTLLRGRVNDAASAGVRSTVERVVRALAQMKVREDPRLGKPSLDIILRAGEQAPE